MPKIKRPPPRGILEHLIQRFREGRIEASDFLELKHWLESEPDVPDTASGTNVSKRALSLVVDKCRQPFSRPAWLSRGKKSNDTPYLSDTDRCANSPNSGREYVSSCDAFTIMKMEKLQQHELDQLIEMQIIGHDPEHGSDDEVGDQVATNK